jgi:hypothetical protein
MTVELDRATLTERLEASPVHEKFVSSSFFDALNTTTLTTHQVEIFLGQWWHPLHYFPTFLARCISVLPDIESKSAVSRILNQETGNGRTARAHEVIYGDSMELAGFDRDVVTGSAPFQESAELVAGYERSSAERCTALGFVYATEVTDLIMVSSIGTAVERATGVTDNRWVAIHVAQEPDHVAGAGRTMLEGFTAQEEDRIVEAADEMWRLWTRFFQRLAVETGIGAVAAA